MMPEGLTFSAYEKQATKTARYREAAEAIVTDAALEGSLDHASLVSMLYCTNGLAGEAGECCNKIKKLFRDRQAIDAETQSKMLADIAMEVGDALWYLSQLAILCGSSLEECAAKNMEKLASRADRGVLGGSGDNR